MPSLNDAIRSSSPAGFEPVNPPMLPPATVTLPGQDNSFKVNPIIRCPIPPTSAGPDTLRQFNDGNEMVPRRRLLPLPTNNGVGGGTTINNTTVVNSSSSGGSTSSLTAKTLAVTSPLLPANGVSYQTLNMSSKSFQLISCKANVACEIRIYGSSMAMAIDASRPLDAPLAAELGNNMITDVAMDTAPFTWNWQNRIGANSDTPQTVNAYIAIRNLGSTPNTVSLTITFLELESL